MFQYISLAMVITLVLFMLGLLPIPVGYERGKVAWLKFCETEMYAHIVYHTKDHGFQTLHPQDRSKTKRGDELLNNQ